MGNPVPGADDDGEIMSGDKGTADKSTQEDKSTQSTPHLVF